MQRKHPIETNIYTWMYSGSRFGNVFFVFISWLQDMLDKAESFFGKKQKFKLQQKGKTAAASAGKNSTKTPLFGVQSFTAWWFQIYIYIYFFFFTPIW